MRIRCRLFVILFVAAALFPPSLFAQVAISSDAPLYFCIGVHIEPLGAQPSALVGSDVQRMPPRSGLDYNRSPLFLRHVADLQALAAVVEKHGGRMTVQAQTPFTSICVKTGERILAGFEKRGHEIALHFHEDAHLGRSSERLPVGTWTAVMKEEIEWIKKAGATRVRYWSGGNLYPSVLDAAAAAGLEVQSDHKNPRRQRSDERLLTLTPWRPAGGPREDDVADFARHDPNGKIIFLPDGVLGRVDAISMRRSETFGGDQKYFDYLAGALRESVKAARRDRVNVFHITVHAAEFRGGPDAEKPFGVIDRWLTDAVDPLVKAGKVKWATFSEMADAFRAWEKKNPGVDPRATPGITASKSSPPTFFAVHCEAHSANPAMWDALCRFVAMADRYEAKLTLMFNPQWAEFIVPDKERFERAKSWQKNGHEIAVHYHNIVHGAWNGHTNRKDDRYTRDSRYRGTVSEMMTPLQKLAAPDTMLTMCMGPDARWDSLSEVEIDEPDYPDGILYDVDGMDVGLAPLMKTKFKGHDLFHLKHHFFATGRREEHLDRIKEEFGRAKPGEVLGVVTHETDFARSPEFIEKWFQFCRENKTNIRTVRDIVKSHPQDKVVEVPYVRQEAGSAPRAASRQGGISVKVRKFQELLKAAKEKSVDTSAAENLDRQSRKAARAGNMAEAEQLLDRAIEALGQKKSDSTDKRGCITFAVNTHDWPHLEESATTVLRLIGIFEKNKVRGDFYLTPQMVEHYEQKRPDVIQKLRQSGMCISYHVRPPHPTYAGFDRRLHNIDDTTLAKMLRDYETCRLDPATGELQRDKPGGYSYVAKVLGRAPVVVSPQCRDPRIRDAALKVYASLGAKMVVAYHESGTKLEQPFEWIQGLLARPSDFSITRWGASGRQETFWWNMLDTPRAADFNPTERLKSQLAAWKGARAPFITVLIHENDFSRSGGTGWGGIYLDGEGRNSRPKQPPYDLNAPDPSRPRSAEAREKIWAAYEAMVAHAAANLRVVTSEEIVAMAKP
ncbi:MAG: hypothetical protein WA117_03165 [Verrucomicrobiia bacterium]